jgi:hypothetical protein
MDSESADEFWEDSEEKRPVERTGHQELMGTWQT